MITTVFSIAYGAGVGFTGTFFVLYLLIPFINKFVFSINKIQFIVFISIAIVYFTVLSTFLFNDTFDEIAWYFVVYLIGAYIRLYPIKLFEHKKITGISTVILFVLCYLSILFIDVFNKEFNMAISPYHFVNNAHKILAILLAISMFCFFKNINIKSSKFINTVSSATFGVLLIHSNSASMIKYLWYDLLNVKGHYSNDLLFVYAIGCVLAIYIVCMLIDLCRIKFIEKPLFNKLHQNSKYVAFCKKIDVILNLDTI